MKKYLAIAVFCATSGSAIADTAYPVAQCLGRPDPEAARTCSIAIMLPCIDQAPPSAFTPFACVEAEHKAWDMLLNSTYSDVMSDLDTRGYGAFKDQVRTAQKAWITLRDLDCGIDVSSNPPRAAGHIQLGCEIDHAIARIFRLRSLISADWHNL